MSVYKVKPFTFDLVLSLAIAAYLAVLYLAVNVSSALSAVYLRAVFLRCGVCVSTKQNDVLKSLTGKSKAS